MENFDYSLIEKGDIVGVGLSGGRDSVALFHALYEYSKAFDFTLAAINVDHGIRGEESERDSEFVRKLCEKYGVELCFSKVDCKAFSKENGISLEESARIKRYAFFEELLESKKVTKIALGHHKNDNVETILLNLFRGAGANGVSGIKKVRGKYIRPLLDVSRKQIDEYVKNNSLPFVEDLTNADSSYSRNFVRQEILPKIEEKFPDAINAVARFSENIAKDEDYLLRISADYVLFDEEIAKISLEKGLDEVIFQKAVFLSMQKLGVFKELYKKNYDDIFALVSKENGKSVDLVGDIVATKEYGYIVFSKKRTLPCFERKIEEGEFEFSGTEYFVKKTEKRKIQADTLSFDFDKLPDNAIIRTRRKGDVFERSGGTVKLKEYLIDKKIPKRLREEMLFIASGNKILAVLCLECGKELLADENTANFLTISQKEKCCYGHERNV